MKKLIIFLLIAAPFVMNAQMTYVPDDYFEQALINLGLDTPPINDSIPTKNIDTVTYLNVSSKNISDLTGIKDFRDLVILYCDSSNLTILDVSKNLALERLYCSYNKLTSLDVSNNTALTILMCDHNLINSLNVGNNPGLWSLWCFSNQLTNLDVSKNLSLRNLACSENALSGLDVTKNPSLRDLGVHTNQLTSINLSNNPELQWLYCYSNNLTSLDVSKNFALDYLYAYENPNLYCIQVIDSSLATNNPYWAEDSWTHYSTDCGYTGVEDIKFENKTVSVNPNPASDYIEVDFGSVGEVLIYNLFGERVLSSIATPPGPLSRGG